jgi:hypothetical protein
METKNNKNYDPNAFSSWENIKHGVLQGSIWVPYFCFFTCINNLPKTMNIKCKAILFVDYTRLMFKNSILSLNGWFEANRLPLNLYRSQYIQFTTKSNCQFDLVISYAKKLIPKKHDIKFLCIYFDSTLLENAY